jgi:hypothetical protein
MPFALSRSYLDTPVPSRRAGKATGSKKSGSKAKTMQMVTSGAVIGGTSFILGYVEGQYGMYVFSKAYPWLSADLVGSLAIYALSAYGALGSADKYLVDAAHGALAYWAGFLGTQQGGGTIKSGNANAVKGASHAQMTQGSAGLTAEQLWQARQYR